MWTFKAWSNHIFTSRITMKILLENEWPINYAPYYFSDDRPDSILCAPHRHCLGKHRWQLLEVLQQLDHLYTCACRWEREDTKKMKWLYNPSSVMYTEEVLQCCVLLSAVQNVTTSSESVWDTNPGGDYTSWLAPPVGGLYSLWWVCSWRGWWLGSQVICNNSRSHS